MVKDFLPISREDMKKRGWQQCDFVYICGDAYVDHSSFGMAIITRLLESRGYKVGILSHDALSLKHRDCLISNKIWNCLYERLYIWKTTFRLSGYEWKYGFNG